MNNEERKPSNEVQEPTLSPEPAQVQEFRDPSSPGLKIIAVVFVLIAGVAAGYGWLQHNAARRLASEQAELRASLAQAQGQEDALTAKVNALSAAQAQEEAARAQAEALKNEQPRPQTSEARRRTHHPLNAQAAPVDDPRWKQVQDQISDQQKALADSQRQIAETQTNLQQAKFELEGNLQSARTELGGDIARNHTELVALEKKGERNYFEFSVEKSKTYHHTGPISISLHKADTKHQYCDLQMLVDDQEITRKHVNLYESVSFYPEGYSLPLELVINHISKDSVQGYVSAPKYQSTQQAAAPSPAPTSASATPPAVAAPDVKLAHRDTDAH
ncbi:MAG: hypothetical protein WAO35_15575 [Terriglobia bacterium]